MDNADFLTFGEAELLVEGLRPTKMETIGSKGFFSSKNISTILFLKRMAEAT